MTPSEIVGAPLRGCNSERGHLQSLNGIEISAHVNSKVACSLMPTTVLQDGQFVAFFSYSTVLLPPNPTIWSLL